MAYLFTTPDQEKEMLARIGEPSIDALFKQVPNELRLNRTLDLPSPMTEVELDAHLGELAARNVGASKRICFQGAGCYDHFVPAAVDAIVGRGEFYTAYTPYQAEASQGSLQAFYEYQTLICQLTGMEVANASLYEGGTAVSEAAFMAMRVTNRHTKVVMLGSVHPEYRQTLQTYLNQVDCELVVMATPEGTADLDQVKEALDDKTACLVVQHPNFFGCLEDAAALTEMAHQVGALSVVSFDPISLGLLQGPGAYGADIAVAEGQPLGIPLQYGGPYLGILTCKESLMRKMPGRLIGETVDHAGNRCFVLNLQAREQHIRREKATSNICSNQGLLALRATVYLSLLGKQGIKEVAELCCRKAHYAAERLQQATGGKLRFQAPFFKEFVLELTGCKSDVIAKANAAGFDIGPGLDQFDLSSAAGLANLENSMLIAVTEKRTKGQIDQLAEALAQ